MKTDPTSVTPNRTLQELKPFSSFLPLFFQQSPNRTLQELKLRSTYGNTKGNLAPNRTLQELKHTQAQILTATLTLLIVPYRN